MPRDYMAKKGINGYTWYRLLGTALRCKPNLLNRVLNDESWLTGLDDGRGVPTDISSANQTHHNKKIRIGDVIPTLILYEPDIMRDVV